MGAPSVDDDPVVLPVILQGKDAEADLLYLRAIDIGEKTLGPDHPDLAVRLNNRALLLKKQVRGGRDFEERLSRWSDTSL